MLERIKVNRSILKEPGMDCGKVQRRGKSTYFLVGIRNTIATA